MKVTQTVYLYAVPDYFDPAKVRYSAFSIKDMGQDYTLVGSTEVTFDVPEVPNGVALAIDVIDRKKLDALELFHKTTRELNERLSKLQALTNEPITQYFEDSSVRLREEIHGVTRNLNGEVI